MKQHIEIIKPGMLSSVQDAGRMGHTHAGVPRSGALDSAALQLGNACLGNRESDAAIEMTMIGAELRFTGGSLICLTGAKVSEAVLIRANQRMVVPMHTAVSVQPGDQLEVGRLRDGARCYLCVRGGVLTPRILGSRSALVSVPDAGLGAALLPGDRLPIAEHDLSIHKQVESTVNSSGPVGMPRVLRVVAGAHYELFLPMQQESFSDLVFTVADQSNRAGVRLVGAALDGDLPERMQSQGTLPGYVQVPPSGQPIVLGVDGPTSGGYPVIACVIEADLPVLAQCALREQVRFQWVSRESALLARNALHKRIRQITDPRSSEFESGGSDA